jgi:hypothetical protein
MAVGTSTESWGEALHVSHLFLSCSREMWSSYQRCESSARLDGKVAIITGANCGIGKFTALDFVRRGETSFVLEWLLSCFVFGKSRTRNSAQRSVLPPKLFLLFSSVPLENADIASQSMSWPLHSQITIHNLKHSSLEAGGRKYWSVIKCNQCSCSQMNSEFPDLSWTAHGTK